MASGRDPPCPSAVHLSGPSGPGRRGDRPGAAADRGLSHSRTVSPLVPDAAELLEQAAAEGNDLEPVTRHLLVRLAELTGLSSTYLAETRLIDDVQYIVYAYN